MAIWTPDALSSEARPLAGTCWRLVEAQHRVSTLKLVDTLAEQETLERLLEETKPPVPPECRHLDYLLSTPFRYGAPYPRGSRFRRAGFSPGVYYASEHVETALAETAFHRLLFFADSPATPWPANALELTAFQARFSTRRGLDLTRPPLLRDRAAWTDPTDYGPCQALADDARAAQVEVLRAESVRDPARRANVALLTCNAFAAPQPMARQTWRMRLDAKGARAFRDFPKGGVELPIAAFADERLAALGQVKASD